LTRLASELQQQQRVATADGNGAPDQSKIRSD